MDSIDRIENLIVNSSGGFFDERNIREDLHVGIRIAKDFNDFLVNFGECPPPVEIDYILGTIRSGIDEFFALAHLCAIIDARSEAWTFDRHTSWDFPKLRKDFLHNFQYLMESQNVEAVNGLAHLLLLTHLELVFLAQHFPSGGWPTAVADKK